VFRPAIVDFLVTLVLAWFLPPCCFLRFRLALGPCWLTARHGYRLLTLGGYLLGMLACLLHRLCFRRCPLALRGGFLAVRRGCWLLALNRCLLRVLHRRVCRWRRCRGSRRPLCVLTCLLRCGCAGIDRRGLLD
jgi:hypothetical protein